MFYPLVKYKITMVTSPFFMAKSSNLMAALKSKLVVYQRVSPINHTYSPIHHIPYIISKPWWSWCLPWVSQSFPYVFMVFPWFSTVSPWSSPHFDGSTSTEAHEGVVRGHLGGVEPGDPLRVVAAPAWTGGDWAVPETDVVWFIVMYSDLKWLRMVSDLSIYNG